MPNAIWAALAAWSTGLSGLETAADRRNLASNLQRRIGHIPALIFQLSTESKKRKDFLYEAVEHLRVFAS